MKKINNHTLFLIIAFLGFTAVSWGQAEVEITQFAKHRGNENYTTFSIILRNIGNATAENVIVTETLHTDWTFTNNGSNHTVSHGSLNPSTTAQILRWDGFSLPAGGVAIMTFNATHSFATYLGTSPNSFSGTVSWSGGGPVSTGNAQSAVEWGHTNLTLTHSINPPNPLVGAEVVFTITLNRVGTDGNGQLVEILNKLPVGYQYVSHVTAKVGNNNEQAGTYDPVSGIWALGENSNNFVTHTPITLTINAIALPPILNNPNQYKNVAMISKLGPDPDITNNKGVVEIVPIPLLESDLQIEKGVDNNSPSVSENITFTINVQNLGPDDATGVVVTDILPSGYTYVGSNASVGTYNSGIGMWSIGNLASGGTATLAITATVLGTGSYNNTATVVANENDPIQNNNSDTIIMTPDVPTANLEIIKTIDNNTPDVGQNVTFTLTVTNDGPDNATGVIVNDLLPNGYTYVSHNALNGTYNQGTGVWNIGNLSNGNSTTLTITATVLALGNYTNTATVSANQNDPYIDNNTDSVTPTVDSGEVDLEISKIASHYGNDNNRYSYFGISVRNNGPGAATDIEVEDILDVVWDFSAQAYVASHGTVTATGTLNREITWNIPYLPSGGVAVLLFRTGQTASFTNPWENPSTKTNTANITSLDQDDTNDANDSVTITSTPYWNDHLYELGVTKTVSPEEPFIGDVVEFTIIVEKSGNTEGGPDSLQLIDKLPPGFTYISSNATRGTYNSTTGIWTVGSGWGWSGTETLTITAIVNAPTGQPDEYKNVVSIFSAGQFSDTEINNNMASVTIPTPIPDPASTDLSVSIQVNNETPEACIDDVIFTITASNLGDNNASGVKVTDLLPSGYIYVSSTTSKGSYVSGTGIWTVGNLAIGANATLTITAKALATGDYVNTVLISYDHSDSNIANNTDEISVTPNLSNVVELSISKTVDNDEPDIATNVMFTIEIENLGSTEATGVVVTDIIPTGFTFVSSSQGTYDSNTRTVTWNVGNLATSANTSFTITAKVKASGNHNNTTMVTSNECDLNTANNSSSVSVVPNVDNAIDLKVTQTVSNEFPAIGATVVFTITAQNLGPNSATGVVVNNLLANGFQLVGTPIASEGSYSSGVWTIGNMADSASATLQVSAIVLGGEGASYLSIAEITGNEPDFDDNIINNRAYEILSPDGQEFLHCDINAENPVFSENFGSGASVFGGELPEGRTNLAYYQPNNPPGTFPEDYVADGSYVIGQDAYQAFNVWKNIPDHTGLPNGYYMIMNADLEPHEFFRIRIDLAGEFCSNTRYVASFWMANTNSQADFDYCAGQGGLILPEIGYFIQNHTGEVLGAGASGEIQYTPTAQWVQYEFIFTTSDEDEYFDLVLFNKAPGGCGNDLAIDDITVYACMTPPIRLDMTIESNQLEVCGGEQVIMSVIYTPNLDDENDDYEWPPASWNDVEYRWQRSLDQITWVDIPGEITDTYIIESFKEEDQAYYRLLYAQVGNIDKASCRFPSDDLFPVFNATPVLGEITPEVDEDELCVGKGPFQLTSEYDTSNYLVWNEEDEVWENVWGADFYEWTSSNDNIATIDPVTGMLTPVAPGYVTITYAVQSPKGECPGSITKVFTIRNADCDAPPSPTKLITNPHILQRTK